MLENWIVAGASNLAASRIARFLYSHPTNPKIAAVRVAGQANSQPKSSTQYGKTADAEAFIRKWIS